MASDTPDRIPHSTTGMEILLPKTSLHSVVHPLQTARKKVPLDFLRRWTPPAMPWHGNDPLRGSSLDHPLRFVLRIFAMPQNASFSNPPASVSTPHIIR